MTVALLLHHKLEHNDVSNSMITTGSVFVLNMNVVYCLVNTHKGWHLCTDNKPNDQSLENSVYYVQTTVSVITQLLKGHTAILA